MWLCGNAFHVVFFSNKMDIYTLCRVSSYCWYVTHVFQFLRCVSETEMLQWRLWDSSGMITEISKAYSLPAVCHTLCNHSYKSSTVKSSPLIPSSDSGFSSCSVPPTCWYDQGKIKQTVVFICGLVNTMVRKWAHRNSVVMLFRGGSKMK